MKKRFVSLLLVLAFMLSPLSSIGAKLVNKIKNISVAKTQTSSNFSPENDTEFYLSNYDTEKITGTLKDTPKPQTFGEQAAENYPSYFHKQTFPDLDSAPDNVEALKNTSIGKIREEHIRINDETEKYIASHTLGKHVSADGQFFGKIEDSDPRITKTVTINHLVSSSHSLGVFAPAGEILQVHIDEEILRQAGGSLTLIIGYPYAENTVHDVNKGRFQKIQIAGDRMPMLHKAFKITTPDSEIGSPFGGMVFLADVPDGVKQNFDITISGGVNNPSFRVGIDDYEDWQTIMDEPSPFMMIVSPYLYWLIPKVYLANVGYPTDALVLWYKISMLSNYGMGLDSVPGKIKPVILIFDTYIPSAAALAYPGLFAAIIPADWAAGALNYNTMMNSVDSWGTIHEMNHNFQYPCIRGYNARGWGVGSTQDDYMEITNNVLSVLSYVLYTDAAMSRTETTKPNGGWGDIVDPYYNLLKLKSLSNKNNFSELSTSKAYAYVELIHSFGADKFLHFLRQLGGGEPSPYLNPDQTIISGSNYTKTEDGFAIFASKFFQKDMIHYFETLWKFHLSEEAKSQIRQLGYEKYFTLQSVYAMGEVGSNSGKPFVIARTGDRVTLDFNKYTLSTADWFEAESVSHVVNATIIKNVHGSFDLTFNDNIDDIEFEVNYRAKFNGDDKEYKRTLKVVLKQGIVGNIEAINYEVPSGVPFNVKTAADTVTEDNIIYKSTVKNFTSNFDIDVNLMKLTGNVLFDFSGEVTFMIYGDDQTLLRINGQEAACYSCITQNNDQTAKNYNGNKLTINVNKNESILIEAYCINYLKGKGSMTLKYSIDGENYYPILSENCYIPSVSQEMVEESIQRSKELNYYDVTYDLETNTLNRFYSSASEQTQNIISINVLDENKASIPPNGTDQNIMFMTDCNFNTWYTANTRFKYPYYYIFEFAQSTSINNVNLTYYSADYAGTRFEYYMSESNDIYSLGEPFLTHNNNAKLTSFNDTFEFKSGKYFIMKVYDGSKHGVSVKEISFNQSLTNDEYINIYPSSSNTLRYSNTWSTINGNYINGSAKQTSSGEISFILSGSDLLLYSINDESKISIDNKEYKIVKSSSVNSPSLFLQGLDDGAHIVKINAKNMIFDAAKTTGQIYEQNLSTLGITVADQIYTGNSLKPIVYIDNLQLVEGKDYKIDSINNNTEKGKADFTISGIGQYTGTYSSSFNIYLDLSSYDITAVTLVYNGKEHKPILSYSGKPLIEGEDYTIVSLENNINAGTARFIIEGTNFCTGRLESSFEINKRLLTKNELITEYASEQKYTGDFITINVLVTAKINGENISLAQETDYDIQFSNNKSKGTGSFTLSFKGNYSGSVTYEFTISENAISSDEIIVNFDKNHAYTGNPIVFDPEVKINNGNSETLLKKGLDFDVEFYNNTDKGEASFKVILKGNYKGEKILLFSIILNLNSYNIVSNSVEFNNMELSPVLSYDGKTLIEGVDYTIESISNNFNAGTANFTVVGTNFCEGTLSSSFIIERKQIHNSKIILEFEPYQEYTGEKIVPEIKVYVMVGEEQILLSEQDYTVSYSNNTQIGIAQIHITLQKNYDGEKYDTFTITTNTISSENIILEYEKYHKYTGSPVQFNVKVKIIDDGREIILEKNVDYNITFKNNIQNGEGEFTVTLHNNYSGEKVGKFIISSNYVSSNDIYITYEKTYTYTGKPIEFEVLVKLKSQESEIELIKDKDYTISFFDNENVGEGSFTITLINGYGGEKTEKFTISPLSLASQDIVLQYEKMHKYNGQEIKFDPQVSVNLDGQTITLDSTTDYTISFTNNRNIGVAKISITLQGNYIGQTEGEFSIYLDLSDYPITAKDFEYTGKEHRPILKFDEIILIENVDYIVSKLENNTSVGIATFTIEGKNNCIGQLSGNFNILPRAITEINSKLIYEKEYKASADEINFDVQVVALIDGVEVTLEKDKDYSISFSNEEESGSFTITLKGNYSGKLTANFNISQNNNSSNSIIIIIVCVIVAVAVLMGLTIIIIKKKSKKENAK